MSVLVGTGFCMGLINVLINAVIQVSTPSHIRGRVIGLLSTLTNGVTPIGMGLGGIVADLLGQDIRFIYLMASLCALLVPLSLIFRTGFHQLFTNNTAAELT